MLLPMVIVMMMMMMMSSGYEEKGKKELESGRWRKVEWG